ncbi:hypothetical protein B0T17DRAFT_492491 [Bombardia bombarda]|uniref:N-acetylgalactosaminide beta-1,3-galactosyltransferase n=1 Tax=Bombardia bombarda TaxID=252184 RepID=A0AA39X1P4_9PEZI|nr:hypothetical protein B0T17DRAFT_492491 [Bombardia bombarda]
MGGPRGLRSLHAYKYNTEQPPTEFYTFETTSAFYPAALEGAETKTVQDLCSSFPSHLMQRIQPVLKMGHGEDRQKRDAQLDSVSACFGPTELLIFSDMDEVSVHGRHVMDIIANLPQAYFTDNPDFDNYTAMRELQKGGRLTAENDPTIGKNGWKLDKYKFLAEVERAWLLRPDRDWYVFYETDTYIFWDNMFRFLSMLDPQAPLYMGSPSPGQEYEDPYSKKTMLTWFANGGPGFVLSRGAMEKLMSRKSSPAGQFTAPPLSLAWLDTLRRDCCGDSVLGWALWHAGIPLSGFFPMFNTYPAHAIPYTERAWCQPALTVHKPNPSDMLELWRWEHTHRQLGRPLLYSDLYEFRSGNTREVRQNWDNGNYDRLALGHDVFTDSLQSCTEACEADAKCLQYMWHGEGMRKCVLMPFMNYGSPRSPTTETKNVTAPEVAKGEGATAGGVQWQITEEHWTFTSGWLTARIDQWRHEHTCETPDWVEPSVERYF